MLSQRLIRLTCPHCGVKTTPSKEIAQIYQNETGEPLKEIFKGEGCTYCHGSGYLGRTGVYELLFVTNEIRQMFSAGASSSEIKSAAMEAGMLSMLQDGLLKVKQGLTTPTEVLRTIYSVD